MVEIIEWDSEAGSVTLTNGSVETVARGDCVLAEERDGQLRFLEVLPAGQKEDPSLGSMSKEEWGDVAKRLSPDITDEAFEDACRRFEAEKRRRGLN
jgi:hypothetical protein